MNIPWLVNGMLDVVREAGSDASIGRLDDAIMHIGLTYCRNDAPDCEYCPLSDLCYAHNDDNRRITDYSCGKGTGVFLGM